MDPNKQNGLRAIIIGSLILAFVWTLSSGTPDRQGQMRSGYGAVEMPYSQLLAAADRREITEVTIQGNVARAKTTEGREWIVQLPPDARPSDRLTEKGVDVRALPPAEPQISLFAVLLSWFPMLLLIGVWIYFMRSMGSRGNPLQFGKSRARLLTQASGRITFDDVAGVDEAKEELKEIVDYLKDPQKFQRLGGKIPKGVLLVGPPGTGKTLLARAVAGEANVPFFTISGSDFVEMFVGVGASRVRDMFEQGKKHAPCIIFIDEIDAMGRHRGAGLGGGNDEREQTLNQMLVEMDGFDTNQGVIIVAATNRPDVLDPALLRPGRFDRQVVVPNPDVAGRERILNVHLKKVPLGPDVKPEIIARGTPGFSGADLANLVNEAALLAARRNLRVVTMAELEGAKDKVMMGAERRSLAMSDAEKALTAYHEAGHALCALHEAASDPVHKATIVPRGRALGMVMRLPESDRLSVSAEKLSADLVVAMGGRVAEEFKFGTGKVTTGASSDIQMATDIARRMVTEWGMSEKLGTVRYASNQQEVFLGHSVSRQQNMSDETARLIDEEVRTIIEKATGRARDIIHGNKDAFERVAQALLTYETLSGEEIRRAADDVQPIRQEAEHHVPRDPAPRGKRGTVPTTKGSIAGQPS